VILEAALIASLASECAPNVEVSTMQALITQESSGNPYAIGVVDAPLISQPTSKEEAMEAVEVLLEAGANISLGLGQINYRNLKNLNMTVSDAFEFCPNIKAADQILSSCFARAEKEGQSGQEALKSALSCYYSNNFTTGLKREKSFGDTSYVERIAKTHERLVPGIQFSSNEVQEKKEPKPQKDIGDSAVTNHNSWDVFKEF
jgi:type IV secretion system protein VirB1